jgi:hypothetical protein
LYHLGTPWLMPTALGRLPDFWKYDVCIILHLFYLNSKIIYGLSL